MRHSVRKVIAGRLLVSICALLTTAVPLLAMNGCAQSARQQGNGGPSDPLEACTQIGCDSFVGFVLPRDVQEASSPVTLRACVDDRCEEYEYSDGADVPLLLRVEATGQDVEVSAEVRTADKVIARLARTDLELRRAQPNGPSCPPTCFQGNVSVPLEG